MSYQINNIKKVILYSISVGFSRGYLLIIFPFLVKYYTTEEFGIYSLIYSTSNFIVPLISLNLSAAILREGVNDKKNAYAILIKSLITIFILSLFVFFSFNIFIKYSHLWLYWLIFCSFNEALFLNMQTFFRSQEFDSLFFIFNLLKVLIISLTTYLLSSSGYSFNTLMLAHNVFFLVFNIILLLFVIIKFHEKQVFLDFRTILLFSVSLIPHSFSQWLMNSSDKIIIKFIKNDIELGRYSVAYTLGMVLLLFNAGMGLALPQILIKRYNEWIEKKYDVTIFLIYSILAVLLFIFINLVVYIDGKYLKYLNIFDLNTIALFIIIFCGFYVYGKYNIFVNYLFYHKKGFIISKNTIICGILNIIFTTIAVYFAGIFGAAIVTFLTYLLYQYLIKIDVKKYVDNLNDIIRTVEVISLVTLLIIAFLGGLFIWLIKMKYL